MRDVTRAERQRDPPVHVCRRLADDQLRGTAACIHDPEPFAASCPHSPGGTDEREPSLLGGRENLELEAIAGFMDQPDQGLPVGRTADSGRCHAADVRGAELAGDRMLCRDRFQHLTELCGRDGAV